MYLTQQRVFEFEGSLWLINSRKSGCYTPMLKTMIGQVFAMLSHYKRVTLIRFDLHQPTNTPTSKRITQFNRRLYGKLKTKYGVNKIGFCWCREQEKAKAQHYHFVLMLDGRRVQQAWGVQELVNEVWQQMGGTCWFPKRHYNMVRGEPSELSKAIYRVSYLAKGRGKGYRPAQSKDYGTSRLKPHDKSKC
ncbi:inovirus-type Gp2 protein [Shewanella chilikensis]|uniref:YagK/YfjJ domain-containing protein n=1 Tax=Shewanella chilikensis TaxID=558541 RepID=UPI00399BE9CC